jgi:hypothetical protein
MAIKLLHYETTKQTLGKKKERRQWNKTLLVTGHQDELPQHIRIDPTIADFIIYKSAAVVKLN